MNTLDRNWELFCSNLEQVKHNNNSIVALCPSHDDKNLQALQPPVMVKKS